MTFILHHTVAIELGCLLYSLLYKILHDLDPSFIYSPISFHSLLYCLHSNPTYLFLVSADEACYFIPPACATSAPSRVTQRGYSLY